MKQLEVNIMGQSYILACPEGGEAVLQEAVRQVDREMCSIRDAGRVKARERIAVLTALNIAFALIEQRRQSSSAAGGSAESPALLSVPPVAPAPPITIDVDGLVRRLEAALGA